MEVKKVIKMKRYRQLSSTNLNNIKLDLVGKEWDYDSSDINEKYKKWLSNIECSLNKFAPLKQYISKSNSKHWVDREVKHLQGIRDRCFRTFRYTGRLIHYELYKKKEMKWSLCCGLKRKNTMKKRLINAKTMAKKCGKR
ncbi:hypothetical protein WA026_012651 [Henosepilachna vigintioctopunctata]|uniref:Uncharacterized protein n=1 Tax=Henosepilachna vigintioctopunctata TaxID=420089 RepID=A0AAW1TXM9_9CUCU